MARIDYQRQTNLFDPAKFEDSVTIVGLGNIGSHAATTLAHLGVKNFHLYDPDKVEIHNLSSQNYGIKDLDKTKALALAVILQDINPEVVVEIHEHEYVGQNTGSKILVMAIDSMDGRKAICAKMQNPAEFIIDGRVGGNQIEVYTCKTPSEWSQTFVDKAASDPCGGRYIAYVSTIIGGIITNQVKKLLKGEKWDKSLLVNVDNLQVIKNFEW